MKYIASCSFGKDSLAMVLRLLEESKPLDEVIFFDTGMEFDSIYHNRNRIKELLFQKHIRFTELHSQNTFLFDMFVRPVKYKNPQFILQFPHTCGKRRLGHKKLSRRLTHGR